MKATFQFWGHITALLLAVFTAEADQLYQYDPRTGGVTKFDGDASQIEVDHWEIWLFSIGAQRVKSNHWGACWGKTAEEVNRQLKEGQKEELAWEKFSGIKEDIFTHFNPLGPIAFFKQSAATDCTDRQAASEKLDSLMNILDAAARPPNPIQDIADMKVPRAALGVKTIYDASQNPNWNYFGESGRIFRDYTDNLMNAHRMAFKLYSELQDTPCSGIYFLNEQFDELQKQVTATQQSFEAIQAWKPNHLVQSTTNSAPTNIIVKTPIKPDDLLNPLEPSPTENEVNHEFSNLPARNGSGSAYARDMASRTLSALDSLCGLARQNALQIQANQQQISTLEQDWKQLDWNKTIILNQMQNGLNRGPSGQIEQKAWFNKNFVAGQAVTLDASGVDGTSCNVGIAYSEISVVYEPIRISGNNENWSVKFDLAWYGSGHVDCKALFSNFSDAQEFVIMLRHNIAAAKPITQEDIDAKRNEFDTSIASHGSQIAALQEQNKQFDAQDAEAVSQIRQGIRLWRCAVTFEQILDQTSTDGGLFSISRDENKITTKLDELRQKEVSADAETLKQIKKYEGLWQDLLQQSQARQNQLQQGAKQAIVQSRETKLAEYRHISSMVDQLRPFFLAPEDELHYVPVTSRDPESDLGLEFKFGQLKTQGANFSSDEIVSLPVVRQFISKFQTTQPEINFSEATGGGLSEGMGDDESLLLQNETLIQAPAPQPKKTTTDLPLP